MDTDKLMFKREHFPVRVTESRGERGEVNYYFNNIYIPPYHPSMREEGIDIDLASDSPVLDQALEDTVVELEGVADKRFDAKWVLEDITRDPETEKIQYGQVVDSNLSGKLIAPFPINTPLPTLHPCITALWLTSTCSPISTIRPREVSI